MATAPQRTPLSASRGGAGVLGRSADGLGGEIWRGESAYASPHGRREPKRAAQHAHRGRDAREVQRFNGGEVSPHQPRGTDALLSPRTDLRRRGAYAP